MDVRLLLALYGAELCLLGMAMALYRLGERPLLASLGSAPGVAFGAALVGLGIAAVVVRHRHARSRSSRSFAFTTVMNLVTVALMLSAFEIAVRALSRPAGDALFFLDHDTVLHPRSWKAAAAANRRTYERTSGDLSYLVYDERLGWTVGPDRSGAGGLYLSSAEGLRSARRNEVLAGPKTRRRVALVGDSYVFAERVPFESSWGHLLEAESAGALEVLNFGVPGYAVDQAFLRFEKDVPAWQPDVVVLGFPLADLYRTLAVYPFIHSPHWNIPFSKPRIVREGDALRTVNVPTIHPRAIFEARSIADLPFLEYDAYYSAKEWRQPGFADLSYGKRLLLDAWADPGPAPGPHGSPEEMIRVHRAIFQAFVRLVEESGALPLIVYLVGQERLKKSDGVTTEGRRLLEEIGVPFLDTTPCVLAAGVDAAYLPDDPHYSHAGNAAVARCVQAALENS